MIASVNGTAEQLSTLRISSREDEVLTAHHIPLETSGNQSVDVFANWYKHLSSKMTALLTTVELVLEMDSSSPVFCKQLGKLDNGRQSTMARIVSLRSNIQDLHSSPRISIGNDWSEIVCVWRL